MSTQPNTVPHVCKQSMNGRGGRGGRRRADEEEDGLTSSPSQRLHQRTSKRPTRPPPSRPYICNPLKSLLPSTAAPVPSLLMSVWLHVCVCDGRSKRRQKVHMLLLISELCVCAHLCICRLTNLNSVLKVSFKLTV